MINVSPINNYNSYTTSKNNISFAGQAPIKQVAQATEKTEKPKRILFGLMKKPKAIINLEDRIAKGFTKALQTKSTETFINWINRNPILENHKFAHLIVLGSTILSATYVYKTLTNKELDKDKRNTLAINQGLVYALSTLMAYTFDEKLGAITRATQAEFKKINTLDVTNKVGAELKNINEHNALVGKQSQGISNAKGIIVIDTVYRFIAPVLVTPLANWAGNKLIENHQKKKAARQFQAQA